MHECLCHEQARSDASELVVAVPVLETSHFCRDKAIQAIHRGETEHGTCSIVTVGLLVATKDTEPSVFS